MPTYHITYPGSSSEWHADQILRSDVRPGDILIWGLTQETRGVMARNGDVHPVDSSPKNIDYRLDETRYYKAITSIYQVSNFVEKMGCHLIILPFICSEKLQMDLMYNQHYHQLPYRLHPVDFGTDGVHPGPRQHRIWADLCIDIIRDNSWTT